MRIALCNEVVRELPFAAQCELAASLGYDGIELAPFTVAEDPAWMPIADLRRAAADAGIAISGLHWLLLKPDGLSLTSEDEAVRVRSLGVMRRLVAACAELGGSYLVHGSPVQRQLTHPDSRGWLEEAFVHAGEAAGEVGVVYCVEPLAPRLTNSFNTVAEAADFVARANLPSLRTMLDTSAARHGESEPPEALLARWLPTGLIAHVHLNDANQRGPGQGADPFAPVLKVLHSNAWPGWVGIEPFVYEPDGPTCAARAIGYVRGIEEALA